MITLIKLEYIYIFNLLLNYYNHIFNMELIWLLIKSQITTNKNYYIELKIIGLLH